MKKRITSLLLALALAASLLALPAGAAPPANRFYDVYDAAATRSVEALRLMGVLDGYADNSFRPNGQLTRAQFCKMVICAMNAEDQLGLYNTVTVYPDVRPSHWASAYINLAAKGKKAISGYSDGKFYPDRTVTLGQAATILLRVLGYKDENIGGVWPDSYLAAAAEAGLMEDLDTARGDQPLTRQNAAILFTNLLRCDAKGGEDSAGGSFLSTTGLQIVEDMVLVSCTATGPDGKETAMQFANGRIYPMAGSKTSNGSLNGYKGTLILENGKVRTFLPDAKSANRAIVAAAVTPFQITDRSGVKYAVTSDTKVYYNSKEQSWSEVQDWVTPGTAMTLCLGAAENVEYLFVGGGDSANEAIIVYTRGSNKGFDALTGGMRGYSIYKNGSKAGPEDLRPYDVATYSSATNSIRVCDTRLTGFYESCSPSPTEPDTITVLGHEFPVLTTAQATLSRYKPGDQITLLLTEDNQVAGAVKPGTNGAGTNAIGIATSVSTTSAKVELLCGITIEGATDMGEIEAGLTQGRLVRVSSTGRRSIGLARLGGGVSRALDLEKRKLGVNSLAETVSVYRYTADGLESVSLEDLGAGPISASEIGYAHLNWANRVDIIVLGGVNNGAVFYGRTSMTMEENSNGNVSYYMEVINDQGRIGPFRTNYEISGVYVAAVVDQNGTGFASLQRLVAMKEVPNTAWSGKSAITMDGRTYTIPATVSCYNRDLGKWVTLEEAHAYASQLDIYASDDGVVRIIETGSKRR